ncbi:MotE family protein [Neokomagataea thailandica]|uniref:Magnesium transporter MgtE intracellular domain-containing protein n=1 Tax=Neokomagataea tanensis NBRC 106556 TaxID=1223519 RepID=A0ABQ0QG69_9PROT|nr:MULTISPECIES: hypothetical protein [Neokomagataea]GBR43603.1 hypothetical protein AA106556_0150 [Neokomagataea tanensis NBRC 106556]
MLLRVLYGASTVMMLLMGVMVYDLASRWLDVDALPVVAGARAEGISEGALASVPSSGQRKSTRHDVMVQNGCAGGGCSGPFTAAPLDPVLKVSLAEREKALDRRERALMDRQAVIEVAEAELQKKMAALEEARSRLDTSRQQTARLVDQDADRLVKIYEAMSPVDAAAILNIMDLRIGVGLLSRMTPRKASAILEVMSPQRAILATQLLANTHNQPVPLTAHNG